MLTITCPFVGKHHTLDLFFECLNRLHIAPRTKLVVLDNSGDREFGEKLTDRLTDQQDRFFQVQRFTEPKKKFNGDVAEVYNYLLPYIQGDWLSLEDDVIFGPEAYRSLMRVALTHYDIGIVSTHMVDRTSPGLGMSWYFEEFAPSGELGLSAATPRSTGWSPVDATHMGCTLIRPSVYLGYQFHVKGPYQKISGQDIYLCMDAYRERNLRTATVWTERCGHLTPTGVQYPMGIKSLTTTPTAHQPDILVSVITPCRDRLDSLRSLIEQLQRQTHQNYEHLICHDGPNRQIAEYLHTVDVKDLRHQYFELDFPYGFSGAPQRNAMIQKARGSIMVFVDDDAEITTEYLETMVEMYRQGYGVGFAQIEHADRTIPASRDQVLTYGQLDSLNGFVDTAIGKGFFWDLFDGHDYRYWMSIMSYLKNGYGFTPKIVGRNTRQFGKVAASPPPKTVELARQWAERADYRWVEAEPLIAQDAHASLTYSVNALNRERFEAGEPAIARNPKAAIFYAMNVLGGKRFEAAERNFVDDVWLAVQYAKNIVKGPFPDTVVEQMIGNDPEAACEYSLAVLQRRTPEVETVIQRDQKSWQRYRERWGI